MSAIQKKVDERQKRADPSGGELLDDELPDIAAAPSSAAAAPSAPPPPEESEEGVKKAGTQEGEESVVGVVEFTGGQPVGEERKSAGEEEKEVGDVQAVGEERESAAEEAIEEARAEIESVASSSRALTPPIIPLSQRPDWYMSPVIPVVDPIPGIHNLEEEEEEEDEDSERIPDSQEPN